MADVTIFHNPECGTSRSTLELLREKGTPYTALNLGDPKWTGEELLEILPVPKLLPFTEEDGDVVHDAGTRRA